MNYSLDLSFGHTEQSLQQYLKDRLERPLSLVLTENSTSMLSARVRDGVFRVRLHRMFCHADSQVLDEIVLYLKNKKGAMPGFRAFICENGERLRAKPPKKVRIKTLGKCHDLREPYQEINGAYFEGMINASITWGTGGQRPVVRKRTLGSYSEKSNMIRISPVLDRKTVPRYFIAFVIYHEMLHAAMGTARDGKRRSIHSREFRRREKLYKDYEKAHAWERGRDEIYR